ncbi:MAG: protein tyrosine phosphatase family protein [bacterium]
MKIRIQKSIALFICFFFISCKINEPSTEKAYEKRFSQRINLAGIDNMAKINQNLYRGAQPTEEGFAGLKKLGIKTIINLRSSDSNEEEWCKKQGLRYYHLKMSPFEAPEPVQVKYFFQIVNEPKNQPVFFHCQLGRDRTGMMAALYRIIYDDWSNSEALSEMDYFGFQIILDELRRYVKDFDKNLLREPSYRQGK